MDKEVSNKRDKSHTARNVLIESEGFTFWRFRNKL